MVCIEEIDYMPSVLEGVGRRSRHRRRRRFSQGGPAGRGHGEKEGHVILHTHVQAGHPIRDIVELAADLEVDLLVIGARGDSAISKLIIGGTRLIPHAAGAMPVLVVK